MQVSLHSWQCQDQQEPIIYPKGNRKLRICRIEYVARKHHIKKQYSGGPVITNLLGSWMSIDDATAEISSWHCY